MNQEGTAPAHDGDFFGRETELADLRRGVDETSGGHGRLFLISGEPGIGKTTLCDRIAAEAARRGRPTLWGRCWEGGGAPAYWPWVQVVRTLLRQHPAAQAALRDMGPAAAELASLAPELRPAAAAPQRDPDVSRFYLFDATTDFLRRVAAQQPLLLILDDVHAADADSLQLLQFLARELRGTHLLVLATYREAEARAAATGEVIGALGREASHLPLRGLSPAEVARLVARSMAAARLAAPSAESLAGVAAALHRATEGNPFFVDETVRLWLAEGQWPASPEAATLPLPDQVREVLRRRLALLPAATREALGAAAVIGREFDLAVLQQVLSRSRGEAPIDGAAVLERLHDAQVMMLLREVPEAPNRYAFAHALTRETLYQDLAPGRRLELHRAAAEALVEHHRADLEAHVADIAHHYGVAADDGEVESAIEYTARAAARALSLCAYQEAAEHRQRVLELFERGAAADSADARARRCHMLLDLGAACNAAGRRKPAKVAFQEAAALAQELGDGRALAHAALGYSGAWVGTHEVNRIDAPDPMQPDDLAVRLIEEALALLGDEEIGLRASLLGRLGVETYVTASFEQRDAVTRDAVELARRAGEAATLAITLCDRHLAVWGPDNLEQRHAMAAEVVELSDAIRDPGLSLMAIAWLTHDLFELGEVAAMEAQLARFRRLAENDRQPAHLWGLQSFQAMLSLLRGDYAEAERAGEAALTIGRNVTPAAQMAFSMMRTQLEGDLGRYDDLAARLDVSTFLADTLPQFPAFRTALALQYAYLRRDEEARREFDRVAAEDFRDLRRDIGWLPQISELSEICAHLGDRRRAALLHRLLLPCAHHNVLSPFVAVSYGCVSRNLGELATLLEDWDAAAAHFATALARNQALGATPWVARTRVGLARMLLRRNRAEDRGRASALLGEAVAAAASLGMSPLLEEIAKLRSSLPADLAAAPGTAGAGAPISANVLRREGDYWTIGYEGQVFRMRDTRGLRHLARLLHNPHREFAATELEGSEEMDTNAGAEGIEEMKRRVAEARAELDEAEEFNDIGRAERAREALDAVTDALAQRAQGARGGAAERARVNVTRAIGTALKRIAEHHAGLSQHLADTIKTGSLCVYTPDSRLPIRWDE